MLVISGLARRLMVNTYREFCVGKAKGRFPSIQSAGPFGPATRPDRCYIHIFARWWTRGTRFAGPSPYLERNGSRGGDATSQAHLFRLEDAVERPCTCKAVRPNAPRSAPIANCTSGGRFAELCPAQRKTGLAVVGAIRSRDGRSRWRREWGAGALQGGTPPANWLNGEPVVIRPKAFGQAIKSPGRPRIKTPRAQNSARGISSCPTASP